MRLTSLLFVAIIVSGCDIDKRQLTITIERGNEIVAALERFRVDSGKYPETLDQLSPKYLAEIRQPAWGLKAWKYRIVSDRFDLTVDESVKTGNGDARWLKYYGKDLGWQTGD